MIRHWLITAFTPFAGRAENNSQHVLRELIKTSEALNSPTLKKLRKEMNEPDWNFQFHALIVPTEYDHCFDVVHEEMKRIQTDGVQLEGILSLGEAKEFLKIESEANNLDDTPEIPDNKNVVRVKHKIYPSLGEKIPFHFPVEKFLEPFVPENRPYVLSTNPGNFVCNNLCAHATVKLDELYGKKKPYFGFIHVPRADQPTMLNPAKCAKTIISAFEQL